MSKVHFWIVCDAVEFIKNHGNQEQKRALQTLQTAYGDSSPVESIPRGETAVENLVGFEAWQTDKFGDMRIKLMALPGDRNKRISGLGWNHFTAFNHFINLNGQETAPWDDVGGYSYSSSSKAGCDSFVIEGVFRCLKGIVDVGSSPVFERIRPFWRSGEDKWRENFECSLSKTHFAPWTVLAQSYYSHLLLNHYDPLEVRGANQHIVGIQLLGPIVHAIADVCSPQHVRSTLAFGHVVWENYVKSRVYDCRLKARPALVAQFLAEAPFANWLTVSDGPMRGAFDVGLFIHRLSLRTAGRLMESAAKPWQDLWSTEGEFWKTYLRSSNMPDDAAFLYSLAVAGTAHAIERSCSDLVERGLINPQRGLEEPTRMPVLQRAQDELPGFPTKRSSQMDPNPEDIMPAPYSNVADILGFEPIGHTDLPSLLRRARQAMANSCESQALEPNATRLLEEVQHSVTEQFFRKAETDPDFCPLRAVESIPILSDLSAHFGTATFRMPSAEECETPELFGKYIEMSDAHMFVASKLQITQAVAGLEFHRSRLLAGSSSAATLDSVVSELLRMRDGDRSSLCEESSASLRQPTHMTEPAPWQTQRREDRRAGLWSVASQAWDAIRDWIDSSPKMLLATVAAAAIMFFIVIPRGSEPERLILGLSSQPWTQHGLTLMSPQRLRSKGVWRGAKPKINKLKLAIIVYQKSKHDTVNQKMIESAYTALRPAGPIAKQYDALAPADFKAAVVNGGVSGQSEKETLKQLHDRLGISRALVVTIGQEQGGMAISAKLEDLDSGATLGEKEIGNVAEDRLDSTLRATMNELLSIR